MKESTKRQFECEAHRKADELDELRATILAVSLVVFIFGCLLYSLAVEFINQVTF